MRMEDGNLKEAKRKRKKTSSSEPKAIGRVVGSVLEKGGRKNKRKFEEMGNRESHSIFHDVVQAKSKSRTNVENEAMERREKKKKMKVGLGATHEVKELMNDCDAHSISHGESIQCNGNERKKHESIRNRVEDKEQTVLEEPMKEVIANFVGKQLIIAENESETEEFMEGKEDSRKEEVRRKKKKKKKKKSERNEGKSIDAGHSHKSHFNGKDIEQSEFAEKMKDKEEEKNKGDIGGVHEDDVHSINHRESRKKGNGNERKIVKSVRNHLENEESNGRGEEGKAVNLKKNQITIVENEAGNMKIKEGKEISRHEGIGSKKRKTKKLVGNESSSFGAGYFHETHVDAEVMEKGELTESKNKKKKKKGDLGGAQEHEDFENIYDDVHSVSHRENNKGLRKIKKKTKSSRNDAGKTADRQVLEVINTDEAFNPYENSAPEKKLKKVRFSGSVEVYPISNSSTEMGRTLEHGLIRGKRFSSEEDEMVRKAVLNYIEVHSLGDEGLQMVLNCKSHPEVRHCWKEIGASLPWRPHMSVYYRAHILFERGESRKWTPEELEFVQQFHEKHGAEWKTIAEELGKHRFHVKDAWRRIKLPNMKKGQWSQEEYQTLFDLVNADIQMKAFQEKKSKHGMLRDNISWEAISNKLSTRTNASCCMKWYDQLTSPMVAEGKWADTDDYHLLIALFNLDASCDEDVDWDSLLEHRPGDVCRKRWSQMVRHIGEHRNKLFAEQVEILSQRYCADLLEAREAFDKRPLVD